jgi:hypothetical protein
MKLTQAERESYMWEKIASSIAERIELHRTKLENAGVDELETARLRGRIIELRWLLTIAELDTADKIKGRIVTGDQSSKQATFKPL